MQFSPLSVQEVICITFSHYVGLLQILPVFRYVNINGRSMSKEETNFNILDISFKET